MGADSQAARPSEEGRGLRVHPPAPPLLPLEHSGIDSACPGNESSPLCLHQGFPSASLFVKNKLEAAPMINHQLLSAPPLAISAKGMNYLEKHPEGEPTVKENGKG